MAGLVRISTIQQIWCPTLTVYQNCLQSSENRVKLAQAPCQRRRHGLRGQVRTWIILKISEGDFLLSIFHFIFVCGIPALCSIAVTYVYLYNYACPLVCILENCMPLPPSVFWLVPLSVGQLSQGWPAGFENQKDSSVLKQPGNERKWEEGVGGVVIAYQGRFVDHPRARAQSWVKRHEQSLLGLWRQNQHDFPRHTSHIHLWKCPGPKKNHFAYKNSGGIQDPGRHKVRKAIHP